ncbi:MAG: hypothetical protein IAG10_25250 [Planctomycetaceae bacterium]|nr:hypothetical protein [Planctomycetaceae bacterium]
MWRTLLVLSMLACCGCGSAAQSPPVTGTQQPPSASELLTMMADSGTLIGEGLIEEEIERIRATDPKKANDLQKEYGVLCNLEEPEAIKQQAKKMQGKFK